MKENEKTLDKFDSMPFIALIHHISKNKLRYAQKNPNHIDMVHEGRYLMEIHKRKDLSQDDLATIDENNRRKYILKTTEKGEELAILLKNDLEEWENAVGIDKLDENAKCQLREIARKTEEILKE